MVRPDYRRAGGCLGRELSAMDVANPEANKKKSVYYSDYLDQCAGLRRLGPKSLIY